MSNPKGEHYTTESLRLAVSAIEEQNISVASAAVQYGVPRTTLRRKLKVSPIVTKLGPKAVFTAEEDKTLCLWIVRCSKAGFPITKNELLYSVRRLLEAIKK